MRKWVLVLALAVVITPAAFAQRILIVTDDPELEVEGAGNLGDYLRSEGYTVDVDPGNPNQNAGSTSFFRDALTQEKINLLESYDLVLVHRSTSSGSFYLDAITGQWNALRVPLLMGSAYLPRSARWQWVSGSEARTNIDYIVVEEPNHPIFEGIPIDDGEVFIYELPLDIDHLSNTDVGNGRVLATVDRTDGTQGTFAAEWPSAGFFMGNSGQQHTHPRVFMAMFRYHEADSNGFFDDYTDAGKQLIKNAVDYTISLNSTGITAWELH